MKNRKKVIVKKLIKKRGTVKGSFSCYYDKLWLVARKRVNVCFNKYHNWNPPYVFGDFVWNPPVKMNEGITKNPPTDDEIQRMLQLDIMFDNLKNKIIL